MEENKRIKLFFVVYYLSSDYNKMSGELPVELTLDKLYQLSDLISKINEIYEMVDYFFDYDYVIKLVTLKCFMIWLEVTEENQKFYDVIQKTEPFQMLEKYFYDPRLFVLKVSEKKEDVVQNKNKAVPRTDLRTETKAPPPPRSGGGGGDGFGTVKQNLGKNFTADVVNANSEEPKHEKKEREGNDNRERNKNPKTQRKSESKKDNRDKNNQKHPHRGGRK